MSQTTLATQESERTSGLMHLLRVVTKKQLTKKEMQRSEGITFAQARRSLESSKAGTVKAYARTTDGYAVILGKYEYLMTQDPFSHGIRNVGTHQVSLKIRKYDDFGRLYRTTIHRSPMGVPKKQEETIFYEPPGRFFGESRLEV